MAQSVMFDSDWASSTDKFTQDCVNLRMSRGNLAYVKPVSESSTSLGNNGSIPKPPPPPPKVCSRTSYPIRFLGSSYVPKDLKDTWDRVFKEAYETDVNILTGDGTTFRAHSSILGVISLALRNFLNQAKFKDGIRHVKILGVPSKAVHVFIRFLYSTCYEEDEMKKYALHLLVLSHSFTVPSLKRVCITILEQTLLTTENVVDVLQLAILCDAPRLSLICARMVLKDFKRISTSEGWKVMKAVNPALEKELLESIVEADSRKHEKKRKMEEKKMYLQLYEAMEALQHICRDGCRTIGPRDKLPKGIHIECGFSACGTLEKLVRHFSICKIRVPGGCSPCKRMWRLLELHSSMCSEPDLCNVPLCRHFKDKKQHQRKRDETKWRLLVDKLITARNSLGPFVVAQPRVL